VAGAELPARARPVTKTAARAAVFDNPDAGWYSSQAQRQQLIDESPMIEIDFGGE
jgi:hypothetical protein